MVSAAHSWWFICLASFLVLAGPSAWAMPRDVLTDTRIGDARRDALELAASQVSAWMSARTGQPAPTEYVLLGAGPASVSGVLDAAYLRLEKPRPNVNANMNVLCGGQRANAISSSDFVLFCFPEDSPERPNPLRLGSIMAHEIFHQMQYDLSDTRDDRPGVGPRRLGPAWLVEGSAEVLELLYVQALLPADGEALFELQNPARRSRKTLSSLQAHGSVRDPGSYGVARFAAVLLARRHGVVGFINYFKGLGQGDSRTKAFERAFGQSMQDFEAEFEAVRRDFGAARDWPVSREVRAPD